MLPFPTLASEVEDIVYLNWVVPTERVSALVPAGVTIADRDGATVLTILIYRHGHFGPVWFGALRRMFGSPLQSNWRLYVESTSGQWCRGVVLFIANIFDSALYTVATRLCSDALPSDLAARFVQRRAGGGFEILIDGGRGSAPSIAVTLRDAAPRDLPPAFARFFADWPAAVAQLCLQEAAVASVDGSPAHVALAAIDLPIDVDTIQPLMCTSYAPGALLQGLGADTVPFCFCVPAASFRVVGERLVDTR